MSLYGLKQAPRTWFHRFVAYAIKVRFSPSKRDSSLFIYKCGTNKEFLLIYVDEIVLSTSSTALLQNIILSLHKEFEMTDLGALIYLLGISITRDTTGIFLSQNKYAMDILERAHALNCNPTRTPVDTKSKLGPEGILFVYMHDRQELHLAALKRILSYVQGILEFGLRLYASSGSSLVAYSNANWAGCPATHLSTSGYCVFLDNNILSWSSKRQQTLSRSSAEDEYRGVANVVVETSWLRNLLRELHTPLLTATLVYCDNVSAVYLFANPVQHQ
ncbi:ribonuclease H-like domain-containing protein [Tanacetum coccineum]